MASTLRVVGTGVAWNTVATIVVKILALANVFLILRHLSVYDYGLVQLVLTVVSTIGGFLLPGLGSVLISDLARERGEGRLGQVAAVARQYVVLQILLAVLASTLLFLGSTLLATHLNQPTIGFYLQIGAFSYLAGVLRSLLTVLATVELRFAFQNILFILDEGIKLLFLLIGFGLGLGLVGVLYATVLAPIAVVILTLPWGIKSFKPLLSAPRAAEPWWTLLTAHRFWGISSSYLTTLNQNSRLWMVQLFLGTEAVGLFSFAQGLASQAGSLITFSNITTPLLAGAVHEPKRFANLGTRALKYHVWIALATLIPGMLLTPFFIHGLFPAYSGAIVITLMYLVTLIPSAANVVLSGLYPALKRQRDYFFNATLLKTFTLVLSAPPLILFFGIIGAAIEPLITISVSTMNRIQALRTLAPGFLTDVRELFVFDATDRALVKQILARRVSFFRTEG